MDLVIINNNLRNSLGYYNDILFFNKIFKKSLDSNRNNFDHIILSNLGKKGKRKSNYKI